VIIEAYSDKTGRFCHPCQKLLRSTEFPFLQCTRDAYIYNPNGGEQFEIPLEVKNTSSFKINDWDGGPPRSYWWQLQHQMIVTGTDRASIACLVGGNRLIWADVDKDVEACRQYINKARAFWTLVENEEPPEIDGSEATTKALKKLYPEDDSTTVNLPGKFEEIDHELQELKEELKDIENAIDVRKNAIISEIGEARFGVLPSGVSYSYSTQNRAEYVVKAKSTRVLRRKKAKK
jgi:predicted phage-related endonuclease